VALVASALSLWFARPAGEDRVAQEMLASHVRASLGGRMVDVASSDRHTVKPWLSARLDYSPPVTDFAAQGFPLVGGRLDYIGGRPVAVLVYKRRQHLVEVFVWPREREWPERGLERDGFRFERAAGGGMGYWLVSDAGRDDLAALARLVRTQAPE
jgi:anti-sigma factor RsiW